MEIESTEPAGYEALKCMLALKTIPHYRRSYILSKGARRIERHNHYERHYYPKSYLPHHPEQPLSQLEFAIKYDGINLEIIRLVFQKVSLQDMTSYVSEHPTSKYIRIIWFLYEKLTGQVLELADVKSGNYVELLDPTVYYTADGIKSRRQRVKDNLLGNSQFCPVVRKTECITAYVNKRLNEKAEKLISEYDLHVIARAIQYLYTKETMSSYEIERERPSQARATSFVKLLKRAPEQKSLDKESLILLQNSIVDPRFKEVDYRFTQNYVGEQMNEGWF